MADYPDMGRFARLAADDTSRLTIADLFVGRARELCMADEALHRHWRKVPKDVREQWTKTLDSFHAVDLAVRGIDGWPWPESDVPPSLANRPVVADVAA